MQAERVKVHLVDGTYELFRAYYGAPKVRHQGQEVGATRAMVSMMSALVAEPGVTHVAVAFDRVIESFRNDLFPGYKTGEGIDPDLYSQFELAEQACLACGLVVWPMLEFEADDALASAAALFSPLPEVEQVVLCSPDKDLAQCVQGSRVVTLDRLRRKTYDEAAVVAKFGVGPQSIPDYLALVGDTADGIPGVPRWGAKSAAQVLAEYVHIEHIPQDVNQWRVRPRGAAFLSENLNALREAAQLYRLLATLRLDVPLNVELSQLRYQGVDAERMQALRAIVGQS